VIAFDFDGTIMEHSPPPNPGVPVSGIKEMLLALEADGCRIVIFSSRMSPAWESKEHPLPRLGEFKFIEAFMKEHDLHYDEIDGGHHGKIPFDVIYDDKAVTATGNTIRDLNVIRSKLEFLKRDYQNLRKAVK